MGGRTFIDTDILVYAYDSHEPQKQAQTQAILRKGIETERQRTEQSLADERAAPKKPGQSCESVMLGYGSWRRD